MVKYFWVFLNISRNIYLVTHLTHLTKGKESLHTETQFSAVFEGVCGGVGDVEVGNFIKLSEG